MDSPLRFDDLVFSVLIDLAPAAHEAEHGRQIACLDQPTVCGHSVDRSRVSFIGLAEVTEDDLPHFGDVFTIDELHVETQLARNLHEQPIVNAGWLEDQANLAVSSGTSGI